MKVELKNIKIVKSMSEETLCFTAVGYVDGIKTFNVSNRGYGGCHDYDLINYEPETKSRFEHLEAWAKTLPAEHFNGMELPRDIDSVIDDALVDYEMRQLLKRITKNKIAYVDDGKLWTVKLEYSPARLDKLLQKKPNAKVLNVMLESEAIALLKVAA